MTKKMKDIKADMKKLHTLFKAIIEVFPSNQNTLIDVLLNNLSHDASNCINYIGDEAEWIEMSKIKDAIKAMETYYDYYLIRFIVEEIEMSFFAHDQIEFEDHYVSGNHDPVFDTI